jgi:hypothetical protein
MAMKWSRAGLIRILRVAAHQIRRIEMMAGEEVVLMGRGSVGVGSEVGVAASQQLVPHCSKRTKYAALHAMQNG